MTTMRVSYPTSFPVRPIDPVVRPLPYPFRGALALSNDAEYLDFEFFEVLMRFMNARGPTPLGEGLGLGLTSSMFFFTAHPYTFSYFDGANADAPRGRCANRIDEYLRAGWIDTIHAYGDFDGVGGCTRAHAVETFRALQSLGVTLEVFSNHGSVENVQNVGADAAYHCGDREGDPAYHADLMEQNGIRYVWTDSLLTPPAEGDHWRARLRRLGRPRPKLLEKVRLQDRREFVGIRRLRGTGQNAPNLSSFLTQVNLIDWDRLYATSGATILYQHLGVLRRVTGVCEAASVPKLLGQLEFLEAFHRLQREKYQRQLWLCGCAELARYVEMVESVRIRERDGAFHLEVPRWVARPEVFFAGLTINLVPRGVGRILYAGRELPSRVNAPSTGSAHATVSVVQQIRPDIWQ